METDKSILVILKIEKRIHEILLYCLMLTENHQKVCYLLLLKQRNKLMKK